MKIQDFYKIFKDNRNVKIINHDKLLEYISFCLLNNIPYMKYKTQYHHILPKCKKLFPSYGNNDENIVCLTHANHYIAHSLLFESIDSIEMGYCWCRMNGVRQHYYRKPIPPEKIIGSSKYQELKEKYLMILSNKQRNRILSEETKKRISITKNQIEENGLTKATNSARKAMKTMKSKLWDGLSYVEWQQKNNRGRKMKKEWIEKARIGLNRIEANGKSVAQNASEKGIITRSKKIINGIPYNEYCSLKLKENNPMYNDKIVRKVKKILHTKKYSYNNKLFTPLEYRSINAIINGKWFVLKNIFNDKINIILPQLILQKSGLYSKTKENYYGKNNCSKSFLINNNKEKLIGCYCEEIKYNENIIQDVSVFLNKDINYVLSQI